MLPLNMLYEEDAKRHCSCVLCVSVPRSEPPSLHVPHPDERCDAHHSPGKPFLWERPPLRALSPLADIGPSERQAVRTSFSRCSPSKGRPACAASTQSIPYPLRQSAVGLTFIFILIHLTHRYCQVNVRNVVVRENHTHARIRTRTYSLSPPSSLII